MQFAVWPSYDRTWDESLALARWAEANGFSGFWYADHFLEFGPDESRGEGETYECWTTLTGIGALVPRLRLVSMVSPITIHHPVVLAKRAITADHVSGGRVALGLGAGWQANEHLAYGFELPPPGPRVDRFAEALEVVHHMVRGERFSFAGHYYRVDDVRCSPGPVGRLPLLVGTGGPRMMRLLAQWADEWNTWGDPDQLAARRELLVRACESVGRDPSTVRRSAQALCFLVDTPEERARAQATARPGASLVGSADELVDLLGRCADLGVEEFGIPDWSLGDTAQERRDHLDRLYVEVLSQLR